MVNRAVHANLAGAIFLFLYAHLARGVISGVISRVYNAVWWTGLVIFCLMMAVAFVGYVLPWGTMSFWALTVITNLFSVLPKVGPDVISYIWGGYYITNHTIARFFCLHYVVPLVSVVVILVHLTCLHRYGSGSCAGSAGGDLDRHQFHG